MCRHSIAFSSLIWLLLFMKKNFVPRSINRTRLLHPGKLHDICVLCNLHYVSCCTCVVALLNETYLNCSCVFSIVITFQHHAVSSGLCYPLPTRQRSFRTKDRTISGWSSLLYKTAEFIYICFAKCNTCIGRLYNLKLYL